MHAHCGCALLWSIQRLPLLSLTPLLPTPHFSRYFNTHPISSTCTSYVMRYYWCSIILFSFPSFSEFHIVVTLLQTCLHLGLYTIMLVFAYMFIFGSTLRIWEKAFSLCLSEPHLFHLTWCPPVAFIFLQTTCHYSLWFSNTPLCIYTKISWPIHQL
jgi:hypothetical protein